MQSKANCLHGYLVEHILACPSSGLRPSFRCGPSLRIVGLPKIEINHQELLEGHKNDKNLSQHLQELHWSDTIRRPRHPVVEVSECAWEGGR